MKLFLIPRGSICGKYNFLGYKDIQLIGYPIEIQNDNYERNKIEFNFSLMLDTKSVEKLSSGNYFNSLVTRVGKFLSILEVKYELISSP